MPFAAVLFAWLDAGARQASILSDLPPDAAMVIKALVIMIATARPAFRGLRPVGSTVRRDGGHDRIRVDPGDGTTSLVPILAAAMGGLATEYVGVLNIALEGLILAGGFAVCRRRVDLRPGSRRIRRVWRYPGLVLRTGPVRQESQGGRVRRRTGA